jgi:translocation and assembly module TamA
VFIPSLDFIARGEYAREVQVSFDYQRVAARFSLLYRRGKHSISPALNFVRYYDINVPVEARDNGVSVGGVSSSAQPSLLRDSCPSACTLTYPELRYTYDARDSILEPTRGFYFTTDFQQTLKPGSFTYFKWEPELRGYLSIGKNFVLAGRIDYGAIILPAGEKSPATERFFGGGANSNRGYSPNRQGPKYGGNPTGFYYSSDPNEQRGGTFTAAVPAGGNGLFLLSGELRVHTDFMLTHSAVVLFVDASRVTSDAQLPWESPLEVAPGLGLRYITPFGPIRVDVGYLVNPAAQVAFNRVQSVFAPIVTQPTVVSSACGAATCIHESRWAYHISLGEAF